MQSRMAASMSVSADAKFCSNVCTNGVDTTCWSSAPRDVLDGDRPSQYVAVPGLVPPSGGGGT